MGLRIRNKVIGSDDIDYSHYLGPNWKRELRERKNPVPKIISPHVSCFDIQVLLTLFGGNCSFVAGDFIKKVPILGSIAVKLGTVFVPRSGKADALTNVLSSMTRRTQLIEETGEFPTLIVFPEGTCTNNTTLTKFRRGAFMDERAVLPVTIKYRHGMVHPAIESLSEPHMVFLLACTVGIIDIEGSSCPPSSPTTTSTSDTLVRAPKSGKSSPGPAATSCAKSVGSDAAILPSATRSKSTSTTRARSIVSLSRTARLSSTDQMAATPSTE
eukprot:CAMPEP_0170467096 /NCGR_PEP_ID=MMETSP0123-20130129/10802_1 /TAXON_ID=182087 /ORGANISM="Favella ehrenbergii, Strain Fehren 1" /LENGTH=270 /DNA_ID=CAMNT_0010733375 /DNA_START=333 /DNA_END=1146 /DNA_ORIENTATION=+